MISGAMKSHTNAHTVRGRPVLKDVKRFRNGSVREINLRAKILCEFVKNHVRPKELSTDRGYQLFNLIKHRHARRARVIFCDLKAPPWR